MARGHLRPSWATEYARSAGEALFPDLYPDLAWCPSFGYTRDRVTGVTPATPNITLLASATWGLNAGLPPQGPGGEAPIYNGTSDLGITEQTVNLSAVKLVTMGFWLYWDSYTGNDDLAFETSANGTANQGAVLINPNSSDGASQGYFYVNTDGTNFNSQYYPRSAAPAAQWNYYQVTLNTAGGANQWSGLYINGDAVTLSPRSSVSSADAGGLGNFTWYFMNRGGFTLFGAGRMGDFFVWENRVLGQRDAVRVWQGEHPLTARWTYDSFMTSTALPSVAGSFLLKG
jgi:hypothetical protein